MTRIIININEHIKAQSSDDAAGGHTAEDDALVDDTIDACNDEDGCAERSTSEDSGADIDHNGEWAEPPDETVGPAMHGLSDARIAAIAVRGCFGLYHLVREHADQRTSVPPYLLKFARIYEEYIIPAAEAMYFAYFGANGKQPDEIPRGLYDVGCVDCMDVNKCARYACRLHQLLESFAGPGPARPPLFPVEFPATESGLLMQIMFVEYRRRNGADAKLN